MKKKNKNLNKYLNIFINQSLISRVKHGLRIHISNKFNKYSTWLQNPRTRLQIGNPIREVFLRIKIDYITKDTTLATT